MAVGHGGGALSLQDAIREAAEGAKHDDNLLIDTKPKLFMLPIESIQRDPSQPRGDIGDVSDMVASIKEFGILQPVIVEQVDESRYQLIMGERRFTAAKKAGLKTIPAIVRTIDEHRKLEVQVIENLHRKAFHPVEEAQAFQRLVDEHGHRHEDLAKILGRSRASISQTLRILSLPADLLLEARASDMITSSVLLEIAKQEDPAVQRKLLLRALRGELTVKSLREIKQAKRTDPPNSSSTSIKLDGVVVTVRFEKPEHTREQLHLALVSAAQEVEDAPKEEPKSAPRKVEKGQKTQEQ